MLYSPTVQACSVTTTVIFIGSMCLLLRHEVPEFRSLETLKYSNIFLKMASVIIVVLSLCVALSNSYFHPLSGVAGYSFTLALGVRCS